MLSSTVAQFVSYPLALVRTRLQARPSLNPEPETLHPRHVGVMDAVLDPYRILGSFQVLSSCKQIFRLNRPDSSWRRLRQQTRIHRVCLSSRMFGSQHFSAVPALRALHCTAVTAAARGRLRLTVYAIAWVQAQGYCGRPVKYTGMMDVLTKNRGQRGLPGSIQGACLEFY